MCISKQIINVAALVAALIFMTFISYASIFNSNVLSYINKDIQVSSLNEGKNRYSNVLYSNLDPTRKQSMRELEKFLNEAIIAGDKIVLTNNSGVQLLSTDDKVPAWQFIEMIKQYSKIKTETLQIKPGVVIGLKIIVE